MKPAQWLTVEDVAWLLQVSPKTLYNQRYRGEPPGALGVRIGGAVRFKSEDLDAFIASQEKEQKG
jgi:excisionase family DNA binding protein